MSILDLGGGTGGHIGSILPDHKNITVADVSDVDLAGARARGFQTVKLGDSAALPFADKSFDIVFCSSVIEHVTGPKAAAIANKSKSDFEETAWAAQTFFAAEIRRVAKSYFVQTPNRRFVLESHSWLPGVIVLLPRPALIWLLRNVGKVWPKSTAPDWNLLDYSQMLALFPGSKIVRERSMGLTKSLIAVKQS